MQQSCLCLAQGFSILVKEMSCSEPQQSSVLPLSMQRAFIDLLTETGDNWKMALYKSINASCTGARGIKAREYENNAVARRRMFLFLR